METPTKVISSTLALGSLLILAGCAHYKAKPLPKLATHQNTDKVTLTYKAFDKEECKKYLGRKNILKKGYQPVQITIANNTSRTYAYSTSSFSLPTVPADVVAKKVYFSTGGRAVGIGLAAAAGSILAVTAIMGGGHFLGTAGFWHYVFPPAMLLSGIPFTAGATVAGVKTSKANKDLKADFVAKSLINDRKIRPSQTLSGIVFVPKEQFSHDFTITLNEATSGEPMVLHANTDEVK